MESNARGLTYTDPPELDHIVHLVSSGKLQEAVDQFRRLGFSAERGGVHADGLTQNALIILTDGVYIELIEFLDKPLEGRGEKKEALLEWKRRRSQHWWWGRRPGWIDWCLGGGVEDKRTSTINEASRAIEGNRSDEAVAQVATDNGNGETAVSATDTLRSGNASGEAQQQDARVSGLVRYDMSQEGGRRALSGKEIRWSVTFPTLSPTCPQRGTYPFWCEDKTPRWWRVPTPSPPHPNLTRGLAALTLLYYPETFPIRLASLQLILSSKQAARNGLQDVSNTIVDTRPPPKTEGRTALPDSFVELYLATPQGPLLPVRIKAADNPAENEWLAANGEGLFEVEISVAPEKLPPTAPPDGIERETSKLGYGRLRLHPMRVRLHS